MEKLIMDIYIKTIRKMNENTLKNYIEKIPLNDIEFLKDYFDREYYVNGISIIPDEKYDILRDILIQKKPELISQVGAKVGKNEDRIILPYWLGSMNKIKPTEINLLEKWVKNNPSNDNGYILSDKLDGISGLLIIKNGIYTLYTRGRGKDGVSIGSDVSHLIKYIKTIPKNLPKNIPELVIRGELVIPINIFNSKFNRSNIGNLETDKYSNVRSMIIGLGGAKTYRPGMKYIQFITYEIIYPLNEEKEPLIQLETMHNLGFKVVSHSIKDKIVMEELMEEFIKIKQESEFQVDGVIVQANTKYKRNIKDNPKYMFAFKMTMGEDVIETTINFIEWNLSKNGRLTPRINIETVELYGSRNNWATGKNGNFIYTNNLGPGAVIYYTKGGEIIGDVVGIKIPAESPQMPNIPYHWDKNHVFIYADNPDYEMCIKRIVFFLKTLDIKNVGEAMVTKLYNNGLDSLEKIIKAKPENFIKIEGIQNTLANKMYKNIHDALYNVELYKLMAATGLFGENVGTRRLKEIMENIPNLLELPKNMENNEIISIIISIKGFKLITAEKIVGGIFLFNKFINDMSSYISIKTSISKNIPKNISEKTSDNDINGDKNTTKFMGKKFVISGPRNKEYINMITLLGGTISSAVSGKTDYLIVTDKENITGKLEKAMSLNIPILDMNELRVLLKGE